jgi:hypothetical protein
MLITFGLAKKATKPAKNRLQKKLTPRQNPVLLATNPGHNRQVILHQIEAAIKQFPMTQDQQFKVESVQRACRIIVKNIDGISKRGRKSSKTLQELLTLNATGKLHTAPGLGGLLNPAASIILARVQAYQASGKDSFVPSTAQVTYHASIPPRAKLTVTDWSDDLETQVNNVSRLFSQLL